MRKFASAAWRMATRSKRAKLATAVVILGVTASSALAFYILVASGSGSGTGTLGSTSTQNVAVGVHVPDGLVPGQSGTVTSYANNGSANDAQVQSVTKGAITTSTPGCDPSWFTLGANTVTLPVVIPANSNSTSIGSWSITFNNTPATDQSACAGATITVPVSVP